MDLEHASPMRPFLLPTTPSKIMVSKVAICLKETKYVIMSLLKKIGANAP